MFHVSPMTTTKKMPTKDKMRKESKYINTKKKKKKRARNTKEGCKRERGTN